MYLARSPSFRAPHASLELIEELMSVAGITPELFHGGYTRTPEGRIEVEVLVETSQHLIPDRRLLTEARGDAFGRVGGGDRRKRQFFGLSG